MILGRLRGYIAWKFSTGAHISALSEWLDASSSSLDWKLQRQCRWNHQSPPFSAQSEFKPVRPFSAPALRLTPSHGLDWQAGKRAPRRAAPAPGCWCG